MNPDTGGHRLRDVGPRLRQLRKSNELTLDALSAATGIPVSTLSRVETGGRKPTLELLLALADHYRVPLDDLVGITEPEDPRVRLEPRTVQGRVLIPLTRTTEGVQAWKMELPVSRRPPKLASHEGTAWFYVLDGRVQLLLGTRQLLLQAGEAVEFDARLPHFFASAGPGPAQVLSLLGRDGRRMHLREWQQEQD